MQTLTLTSKENSKFTYLPILTINVACEYYKMKIQSI